MPQRNIDFSENQHLFIDRMIEEGAYNDASELVRSALHRFQEEHERSEMEWAQYLRTIGEKALDTVRRGEGKNITSLEERQRVFDEIRERAITRAEKNLHENS